MIHIHMPSLEKPKPTYPLAPIIPFNQKVDLTKLLPSAAKPTINGSHATLFLQAAQRDRIIKRCAHDCNMKEGDICVLVKGTEEDIQARGNMNVERICRSYTDYGKDTDWPEHDRPFILLVSWWSNKENKKLYMYCSIDLVKKKDD